VNRDARQSALLVVSSSIERACSAFFKGTVLSNVARAVTTSALSQGAQTLSGLQDRFSFKQVAIAGVQAGVTSAVSTLVASGLQDKFSWSGVAAAGITAGVTGSIHISGGGSRAAAGFGFAGAERQYERHGGHELDQLWLRGQRRQLCERRGGEPIR
jgi:hypothetical protein